MVLKKVFSGLVFLSFDGLMQLDGSLTNPVGIDVQNLAIKKISQIFSLPVEA
jgi:hypothetical protein